MICNVLWNVSTICRCALLSFLNFTIAYFHFIFHIHVQVLSLISFIYFLFLLFLRLQTHSNSTKAYCFNIQKTWTYPFLWIYKATNQIVRMSWLPVYRKHHVIEFIPFLSPVSYQNAQSCFPCYKNAFVHNTDESVFYTKLVHILTYSLETGKVFLLHQLMVSIRKKACIKICLIHHTKKLFIYVIASHKNACMPPI